MATAGNLNIFGGRNSTVVTLATRNVRIAKGAVPLYDRMMSDSKFITYGITFDVGKSVIKPEILRRGAYRQHGQRHQQPDTERSTKQGYRR